MHHATPFRLLSIVLSIAILIAAAACATASADPDGGEGGAGGGVASGGAGGAGGELGIETCVATSCSADRSAVLDCEGEVIEICSGTDGCDPLSLSCSNGCAAASQHKQSVGCDYYATKMLTVHTHACFAAFVANLWHAPAHIDVSFKGQAIDMATYAKIPSGSGATLQYLAYDPTAGLAPGEVAILFLAGGEGVGGTPPCPVAAAIPTLDYPMVLGRGVGASFHIETDVPVVAYQMNPYSGAGSQVAGASLLLPSSAWDTNYVLAAGYGPKASGSGRPSLNIIAAEDDTEITLLPIVDVSPGFGGLPAGSAGQPLTFTLQRGQQAQLTEDADLTGSILEASKPVGVMAGNECAFVPSGVGTCDHIEEVIPPVRALGSEYVSVMHRPRAAEYHVVRLVGAVDGTQLSWSPAVGGPASIDQGEIVEIQTTEPFVVKSQDDDHPFLLLSYMVGQLATTTIQGDPEVTLGVPPAQFLERYVFVADPTYPETNLVVVRTRGDDGHFADVELDCAGALGGWQPIGDYEWTRTDLTSLSQPVGSCSSGRREMKSTAPFGLWIWGWDHHYTSYGYPAGMNVEPISDVTVGIPK